MADEQKTIEILMKFGIADQAKAETAAAALKNCFVLQDIHQLIALYILPEGEIILYIPIIR